MWVKLSEATQTGPAECDGYGVPFKVSQLLEFE